MASWDAVPGLSIDAISAAAQERAQILAFQGVNFVLMISRLLLLAQYLLGESRPSSYVMMLRQHSVLWYRKNTPGVWERGDFAMIPALFIAAVCFLSAFILVSTGPPALGTAIGQIIFWVSHCLGASNSSLTKRP